MGYVSGEQGGNYHSQIKMVEFHIVPNKPDILFKKKKALFLSN